jgi:hypothetical protein
VTLWSMRLMPVIVPLLPKICCVIMQLYVSKDLGDTWVFLGGNISRYRWRVLDEEFESNTSLYFEKDINGEQGPRGGWPVADFCAYLAWAEPEAIADAFSLLRCLP